jgi:hypothetical protein
MLRDYCDPSQNNEANVMSSHIPPKYREHTRGGLPTALSPNLSDLLDPSIDWTPQAADAWVRSFAESIKREIDSYASSPLTVRKTIEHEATIDCLDPLRRDPDCPPALREAIERHVQWRMRALYLKAFKAKAGAGPGHLHHGHPYQH